MPAVPSPYGPYSWAPPHLTPPFVVSAQVCSVPVLTAATPLVNPLTFTGVLRLLLVPSPNWPRAFPPQHLTPPLLGSAQGGLLLSLTAPPPLFSPITSTLTNLLVPMLSSTLPLE